MLPSGPIRAFASVVAIAGAGVAATHSRATVATDPPLLVPWSRIGDIALEESKARVQAEYGGGSAYHVIQRYGENTQGYYRLHGTRVVVTFYGRRVGELDFETPYYRTKSGFGVGSHIPLGPCHATATTPCEHRWHGFVWNLTLREKPCGCWTKVGLGARSLPATVKNYLRPWFFIYTSRGHVTRFYFALKYVD
jgi:hypothetical protein